MNEPRTKPISIKRALISVANKTGVVELAKALIELDVEIISTGGTSETLRASHIPHREISEITGLKEMFDGRVKTLHPHIHGGILGKRDHDLEEAKKLGIGWIDLVVVNFYPFAEVANKEVKWEKVIEYIDIGGPTMVRAAAKNFAYVGVIVDPKDYEAAIEQLRLHQGFDFDFSKALALKAFETTAKYDAVIHQYFLNTQPETKSPSLATFANDLNQSSPLHLAFEKGSALRYGENPHQKAYAYQIVKPANKERGGILSAMLHQGKALSYNNILDTESAFTVAAEFDEPACVIVKHTNPCGAAQASSIDHAYQRAYQADPEAAFGGIIALNRPCTKTIAASITNHFVEVVIAPGFTKEALSIFKTKPNLRVIELSIESHRTSDAWEMKFITGGVLMQEKNKQIITEEELVTVTDIKPTEAQIKNMLFAWRILKHIKSNSILLVKDHATVGIGAGQVSRIDAVQVALRKAGENVSNTVLASDAFFPFRDSIDCIAKSGIQAIIQPGGSMRDEEVIAACNEHKIAMVFSGKRCFKH